MNHLGEMGKTAYSGVVSEPDYDYGNILDELELEYSKAGSYYHVGRPDWYEGWIIHISAILPDLVPVLRKVVPFLKEEAISFKIPVNADIASSILNGQFGYIGLGKVITIYPNSSSHALLIARKLVPLTNAFRGPYVRTDKHLGGLVFVRYGAIPSIANSACEEEGEVYYLHGDKASGHLSYTIPFLLPQGIEWPFSELTSPDTQKQESILNNKYKPMAILKEDARGNVIRALYLKRWWNVKWCILKEGKYAMLADAFGRDVEYRLKWQYKLHKELATLLPIPEAYDIFQNEGDTYLPLEFVKGTLLEEAIRTIFAGRHWNYLNRKEKCQLLSFAESILDIVRVIHNAGYIHRDLNSCNFIITNKRKMVLIDLELMYSSRDNLPNPPLPLGTVGYMSPEQLKGLTPTVEQDIYAIGALFIMIFGGLHPSKFDTDKSDLLKQQIELFIPLKTLARTITSCLAEKPDDRPDLTQLIAVLRDVRTEIVADRSNARDITTNTESVIGSNIVKMGIDGLVYAKYSNSEGYWISKTVQQESLSYYQMQEYTVYPGFGIGVSGVLCLLSQASRSGIRIDAVREHYDINASYVINEMKIATSHIKGLYCGTVGASLALGMGIQSGLVTASDDIVGLINASLLNFTSTNLDIANGVAGNGLAIIQNIELLDKEPTLATLRKIVDTLVSQQERDGSWDTSKADKNNTSTITGFGNGVAGIVYFLLIYLELTNDSSCLESVCKGLDWLINKSRRRAQSVYWRYRTDDRQVYLGLNDGVAGIALVFIKAYSALGNSVYKKVAELALANFCDNIIDRDLTLSTGLAGLGEIYLEAFKVFKDRVWKLRSDWIANFMAHQYKKTPEDSIVWYPNFSNDYSADFLTGNSGIIYFLLRHQTQGKVSHPLII